MRSDPPYPSENCILSREADIPTRVAKPNFCTNSARIKTWKKLINQQYPLCLASEHALSNSKCNSKVMPGLHSLLQICNHMHHALPFSYVLTSEKVMILFNGLYYIQNLIKLSYLCIHEAHSPKVR